MKDAAKTLGERFDQERSERLKTCFRFGGSVVSEVADMPQYLASLAEKCKELQAGGNAVPEQGAHSETLGEPQEF
eukprot:1521080-Amphidinium_carterae.2